jgi:hypothetical protein
MKPGDMMRPVASISRTPSAGARPTATIRPDMTPTSPMKRGRSSAVDNRAIGDLQVIHGEAPSFALVNG